MKAQIVKKVRLIIIASVVGMWMLLFGFFVQALGPGTVAHDVETVLAARPPRAEAVATVVIANTSRSPSGSLGQGSENNLHVSR